ncbi:MAG TPA: GNAT family N-acetyltransferase [Stellaceae bacterium]|jgi:L-amino acid N-acyltransferase YncA|nr:GNAT family N-acetyltransferase [Stellaceae bacterium]
MTGELIIRPSRDDDIAAIAAIYGHHVLHGIASFEEMPPSVEEMARRRADIVGRGFPYLVAERAGRVVGYCYAGPYRARIGYRFTVEDSIYIDPNEVGRGIGRALLAQVIDLVSEQGYRQMIAVIGGSETLPSIRLHAALGFAETGTFPAVGFKFGRWIDSVYMQRALGPGATTLPQEIAHD